MATGPASRSSSSWLHTMDDPTKKPRPEKLTFSTVLTAAMLAEGLTHLHVTRDLIEQARRMTIEVTEDQTGLSVRLVR